MHITGMRRGPRRDHLTIAAMRRVSPADETPERGDGGPRETVAAALSEDAATSTLLAERERAELAAADRITEDAMQVLYAVRQDLCDDCGPQAVDLDRAAERIAYALRELRSIATDLRHDSNGT